MAAAAAVPAADAPALSAALLTEPHIVRYLGLLTRRDRPPTPAAESFLALLRQEFD